VARTNRYNVQNQQQHQIDQLKGEVAKMTAMMNQISMYFAAPPSQTGGRVQQIRINDEVNEDVHPNELSPAAGEQDR